MERLKKSSFAFALAVSKVGILQMKSCFVFRFYNILKMAFFAPLDAQAFKKAFEDAQNAVSSNAEEVEELLQSLKVDDQDEKKSVKEKEVTKTSEDNEPSSTKEGK